MAWPGRRVGAAAVLLRDDRDVLLVHHTYGRRNWELPGGASEPGEPILETALRELREETGLAARGERLTGVYYEAEGDAHHFVFLCRLDGDEDPKPTSSEISECAYWPLDALPRHSRAQSATSPFGVSRMPLRSRRSRFRSRSLLAPGWTEP
jgi:8-oxo-dGTP diphosphatase